MSSTTSSDITITPSPPRSPSPPVSTEELASYQPLFRRRKPPISHPPVPCIRCALIGMHCVYYRREVRCQRCERNDEEFCVFQREDLTKPEAKLTLQQLEQLEQLEKEETKAAAPKPRHLWLMPSAPRPEDSLQCMVYSRDPELSHDRARLLAIAAEMLAAVEAEGTTYVHGQPVAGADARNFVLPRWQEASDWRQKRDSSPEYRKRAAYFEGLTAQQAAAASRSRRLGEERRKARELNADQKRREREEKDLGEAETEAGPATQQQN